MHYDQLCRAGSMAMATGYYLAKEGGKTLLLDAFNPPHDKGSHHGETSSFASLMEKVCAMFHLFYVQVNFGSN